jgi:hypothetical protein
MGRAAFLGVTALTKRSVVPMEAAFSLTDFIILRRLGAKNVLLSWRT